MTHIATVSGILIDIANPKIGDISLNDIAHSLSMQNRFNGHTKRPYSVAEHSVNVSNLALKRTKNASFALWGLMHDACETYIGDCVSPLKRLLPEYSKIEEKFMEVIARKFNLGVCPEELNEWDQTLLQCEAKAFNIAGVPETLVTKEVEIFETEHHPSYWRYIFTDRYYTLVKARR